MDNHHAEHSCATNIIKDTLNCIIVFNNAICINQTFLLKLMWISSTVGNIRQEFNLDMEGFCFLDQDFSTYPFALKLSPLWWC